MRQFTRFCSITLVFIALILGFSSWNSMAIGAPLSPRENPEFWNKLSSVVLVDPTWTVSPQSNPVFLPTHFDQLFTVLTGVPIGPNVLCNQDQTSQAQNEPSIDVNPSNPNHIIATSNDYRLRVGPPPQNDVRAGYYVSFDGGNTWPGDGIIDISTIPNSFAAGDPAIAIHDANNIYYSYIAFNRSTDDGGVAVSKSTDGGLTWQNPVVLAWNSYSVFHDKEYIAVDSTGSAYDGNVYVTWTRFSAGSPIYISRSTNGGASFSVPYQISDTSYYNNQGSVPSVGSNGVLYVVWYSYDTYVIRMAKSTNGGQSFGTPFAVAGVDEIPSPLPGGSFRDNSYPTFVADPQNGNLYVAWSDYRNNDADIYFTRSVDQGVHWSVPIRINDDPLYNHAHQFFPWIDVAPNGNVYLGWFDSRLDPTPLVTPLLYDEYAAVSTDGGLTFSPNQRISEQTSNSSLGGFPTPFIGDYSGLAATNDFVFPAWVDTRRNQQDIYTQKLDSVHGEKLAPAWVDHYEPFTYTVNLTGIVDLAGNQVVDPLPVEVSYVPDSAWASSGTVGFSDGSVTWNGDISAGESITITFAVTPTADACLPINNTALLTTGLGLELPLSATSTITGSLPTPDFSYLSTGLVFTFTNETTDPDLLSFTWDFGDGTTSSEVSPVHEYAYPGQYSVTLTASNHCGAAASSQPVEAVCSAPQAAFSWVGNELSVAFNNESSGEFPLSFQWDFGDGFTSTLTSPIHNYLQPGTFDVLLSASDVCGSDSATHQVTTTCTAPEAFFTWQASNLTVSFTNQSSGTPPLTFLWEFGDGTTSTDPSPTHAYSAPGWYAARLVVTAPCGTAEYQALIKAGSLIYLPLLVKP